MFKKRNLIYKLSFVFFTLFTSNLFIFSQENNNLNFVNNPIGQTTYIVLGIGIILILAKIVGNLLKKIKIPSMLGELLVGIVISPYLLGGMSFYGFSSGLFPLSNNGIGISYELLLISMIASVILFFIMGLQTDLSVFTKYSSRGIKISIISFIFTFCCTVYASSVYFATGLLDPKNIIIALIFSAGTIGIASRILSKKSVISSNEKLTIFSSILTDNTITIVLFAVITELIFVQNRTTTNVLFADKFSITYIEQIAIWLAFLIFCLIFVKILPNTVKYFKNIFTFSLIILSIIMIISGFSTLFGIPIIIFAYLVGLILSKTNLNFIIRDNVRPLFNFFSPLFFVIIGMMIDIKSILLNPQIMIAGLIFCIIIIAVKIIFNFIPSLMMKYNFSGALRITLANIPRFEVSLIIASIAYYMGILNKDYFDISVVAIILSTVIISPIFYLSSIKGKAGIREKQSEKIEEYKINFGSAEITRLVMYRLIDNLKKQDFLINLIETDTKYYQAARGDLFLCIDDNRTSLVFETSSENFGIVKAIIVEVIFDLDRNIKNLINEQGNAGTVVKQKTQDYSVKKFNIRIADILDEKDIILNLKANTKMEVIEEMIDLLYKNGRIKNKSGVMQDLLEREKAMSTGIQQGIAIPHCKSKEIDEIIMSVGIKRDGINFDSIDGKPSRIFVLILTPEGIFGPHIRVLMMVSSILGKETERKKLLSYDNTKSVYDFFTFNENIYNK